MKPKTARRKFNNLQLNSISYMEEISDAEATKINGGNADAAVSVARSQALYQQIKNLNIEFQEATTPDKLSKLGKV